MATSIKLDDDLKARLKTIAGQHRRSSHWIMREAIRQYVEREERREDFKQEALEAWKHFQRTGEHLTGREVETWLGTWGTDTETAAPKCHD